MAPDERGVFDGRELARYLIAAAYMAVVPYVDGCRACADNLFSELPTASLRTCEKTV